MPTYKITNVAANKCLNIYGDNITSLTNNQNVTLWADSNTPEQKWVIDSIGNGVFVKSAINTAFALNVYRGKTYNCDVYPLSGNQTDAAVNFVPSGSGYQIQLTNYPTYYLTAAGTANGSNVYWATATNANNQLWAVSEVANAGPKNHSYIVSTNNAIKLHIIKTAASNITLQTLEQKRTLTASPWYGINGGFYNRNYRIDRNGDGVAELDPICLNVAANNGVVVGPYSSGGVNGLGSAVLAFMGNRFEMVVGTELTLANVISQCGTPIWAQGGGNLKLGDPSWTSSDLSFSSDALVNSKGRTALVADTITNEVYLIIHKEASYKTIAAFRTAIHQYLGIADGEARYLGILLDGGDSSSLKAKNYLGNTVAVDPGRLLCQIVALKDAT